MSTMPFACVHENAWVTPERVVLLPTIWPSSLTSFATLLAPPRVPRSTIPVDCVQENACVWPEPVRLVPTTSPLSFTAFA